VVETRRPENVAALQRAFVERGWIALRPVIT
jgi:hypothetical protein